jgi:Mor family transcriptional regulator
MSRKGKRSPTELVTRLVDIGSAKLTKELGASGEAARQLMRDIAHELCREYGGTPMYIPKDADYMRDVRDEAIWAEFDGTNVLDLATKYDLTAVQIYCIVKMMRAKHSSRSQPRLPGFEDPEAA